MKRAKSLDELIPWLYLRGVSSGDFQEALTALVGEQAEGLSASRLDSGTIQRLGFSACFTLSDRLPQHGKPLFLLLFGQREDFPARVHG